MSVKKLFVGFFVTRNDTCFRCQVLQPKYSLNDTSSTIGEMPIVALIEGVGSVILEENDFEYRELHLPHVFQAWSDCKDDRLYIVLNHLSQENVFK